MVKLPAASIAVRCWTSKLEQSVSVALAKFELDDYFHQRRYRINNVAFRVTKVEGPPHFLDL